MAKGGTGEKNGKNGTSSKPTTPTIDYVFKELTLIQAYVVFLSIHFTFLGTMQSDARLQLIVMVCPVLQVVSASEL